MSLRADLARLTKLAERLLPLPKPFAPLVVASYPVGDPRAGGRPVGWHLGAGMVVCGKDDELPPWRGGPCNPPPLAIGVEADPSDEADPSEL